MSTSEYRPASLKPRILIVEDEFIIADMLAGILEDMGGEPVGPIGNLDEALKAIPPMELDAVIIDVLLGDRSAYPIADHLSVRRIPFGFASGTDGTVVCTDWAGHPFIEKPYSAEDVAQLLRRLIPHFTADKIDDQPTHRENGS